MILTALPAPWDTVLDSLIGPVGALAAMGLAIFFLWRLFREEQKENRENFKTVGVLADALVVVGQELKAYREGAASVLIDAAKNSRRKGGG